jgi:hypothetical protein
MSATAKTHERDTLALPTKRGDAVRLEPRLRLVGDVDRERVVRQAFKR